MDPELQSAVEKIVRSSSRMQSLINDLLKLSRHAHTSDDFRTINLNDLISEVLGDIEVEIQSKKAKVIVEDMPVIWAIPSQIRQLFQNIISNSLKFSKEDRQPKITIYSDVFTASQMNGLTHGDEENNFHRIYIKDNGIGFDPKYAEDIFIVFKRLHSHHEFEGTGIGLSICKKIVEKHKGFIQATSKLNEGSTFVILLPQKIPVFA
jgi:light-regulated signal transduction histidine kinase (bacteriophytochrome)